jgi:hypothetical protein
MWLVKWVRNRGCLCAPTFFSAPQERGKSEKEKKERHIRLFTLRYLCFSPFLRKPFGEGAQGNKFPAAGQQQVQVQKVGRKSGAGESAGGGWLSGPCKSETMRFVRRRSTCAFTSGSPLPCTAHTIHSLRASAAKKSRRGAIKP